MDRLACTVNAQVGLELTEYDFWPKNNTFIKYKYETQTKNFAGTKTEHFHIFED